MCEYVSGEILLSFPNDPELAELFELWFHDHGRDNHVHVVERLDERLGRVPPEALPPEALVPSPTQLWRVAVPAGQETAKSTIVGERLREAVLEYALHLDDRGGEFVVFLFRTFGQPNHVLTLNSTATDAADTVVLTDTHTSYRALVGLADGTHAGGNGGMERRQRVAIVDTGVSGDLGGRVVRRVDVATTSTFGRPEEVDALDDPSLHGTTVASIIADLDHEVELMVYRVGDGEAHTTEFDVIAALLSMADADVVNLSLAFGLDEPDCEHCGRAANSSRSIVFEDALHVLLDRDDPPIVVAAAGNTGALSLSYPARFADVVAVGAVNGSREMSSFSNSGTTDQDEEGHERVWFLPGGDDRPGCDEAPAMLDPGDTPMKGTSYACAYASALITRALREVPTDDMVDRLRTRDGDPLRDHDRLLHGHGLLTLAALTEDEK